MVPPARLRRDLGGRPRGKDQAGRPVWLADPWATRSGRVQAKVAEATMAPAELTSFAPRSRPISTWMFLEN